MSSYCLKCRKDIEHINPRQEFQKLSMVKQCYYQNVHYAVLKNQGLLKIKKQKDW